MVRVLPLAVAIDVEKGQSLMTAARRQGYYWPTVCGGNGECGTCWVLVQDGAADCSPTSPEERQTLSRGLKPGDARARLGCQLRVGGPVTVYRRGVRRAP